MTHAIYIAVILVLAGVACWLWRARQRTESELGDAVKLYHQSVEEREGLERVVQIESRRAKRRCKELAEARDRIRSLEKCRDLLRRSCDRADASNRSYKGWNGRYRRRIAALEAELADERGEV